MVLAVGVLDATLLDRRILSVGLVLGRAAVAGVAAVPRAVAAGAPAAGL